MMGHEWDNCDVPIKLIDALNNGGRIGGDYRRIMKIFTPRKARLLGCAMYRLYLGNRKWDGDGGNKGLPAVEDWADGGEKPKDTQWYLTNPYPHTTYRIGTIGGDKHREKFVPEVETKLIRDLFDNPLDRYLGCPICNGTGMWARPNKHRTIPHAHPMIPESTHTYQPCYRCHQTGLITDGFQELLRWNDGAITKAASSIYKERRWEEMPIIADMLQDAGLNPGPCPYCKDATFDKTDSGIDPRKREGWDHDKWVRYMLRNCPCGGTLPLFVYCTSEIV